MRHEQGLSLLEVMLAVAIASAVAIGAVSLLGKSRINAAINSEQRQLQVIIDQVNGQFSAQTSMSGLTTSSITDARPMGLRLEGEDLRSAFSGSITVEPSTTLMANDSFDVIYHDLNSQQCAQLVPALIAKSSNVLIDGASMQGPDGRLRSEAELLSACGDFSGSVVFRFHVRNDSSAVASIAPSCLCTTQNDYQTNGCPVGQVGLIRQSREGTCTGGTPACPALEWQPWSTLSNTCITPPSPPPAVVVVVPPAITCNPYTINRTQSCAAGMQGMIGERQDTTCVAGAHVAGPWVPMFNTCTVVAPPVTTCVPYTESRAQPCPAGYGGQITEERSFTCASAAASPMPTAWIEVANSCTSSCLAMGTCCIPDTQTRTQTQACPDGSYGSLTVNQQSTSTCASATATPAPGPWTDQSTTGTCTACPVPSSDTQLQWVATGQACPAGESGAHTWEREEISTRSVAYVCPSGTTALPAPFYGAWSSWSPTGARRNEANTCAPPSGSTCSSGTMGNDVLSPANWWCPGYNTSTSDWPLGRPTLIGVDDIYVANVTDDPQVGWDNPAGGGVITGWVTMPKASWQGCGMPGGDVAPAVGEYFHASIYPRRTDTPWPAECL